MRWPCRVERLLKSKKMKNNASEKWVAGLLIMVSALLITLSTGAALNKVSAPLFTGSVTEIQVPSDPVMKIQEPTEPLLIAEIVVADTSVQMDVRDNNVINTFRDKDGNMKEMKFLIRQGEVKELYVDGERIPDDKMSDYQKETDKILEDLSDMEKELKDARTELEEIDIESIKEEIHQEMEHFHQFELQEIQEELQRIHEDFDFDVDVDIDREEMEKEIRETMEASMEHIKNIDMEAIEKSIQEAMTKMEHMDFSKMEENMRKSIENLEHEHLNIDKGKKKLDEMILELEKLELGGK